MTGRLRPEDELRLHIAERLHAHKPVTLSDAEVHNLAHALTEGWAVKRVDYPNSDEHPLKKTRYGHHIRAELPFGPETDAESGPTECEHGGTRDGDYCNLCEQS